MRIRSKVSPATRAWIRAGRPAIDQEVHIMWQILADGITWVDADDLDCWPYEDAVSLAAMLGSMGYKTELVEA